ncbi:MAG: HDIG domain-containing protein [Candidatus Omnitrophica bacterium]|nr:HDIG domain-containing protein [Candidatus Omnitrophota bacterium]
MKPLCAWRQRNEVFLKAIQGVARKERVRLYLVGGVIRDALCRTDKADPDFDFCLRKHAIPFTREVAAVLGAGFVVLDKEHGCARAVKKLGERLYTFDFSDFRGPDIFADLLHRDFTVNSMAIPLDDAFFGRQVHELLIDPFGGAQDLRRGIIRTVNRQAFDEDPVRVMRAFSLTALFGFRIDRATLALILEKKGKLRLASAERVRDELFKILSSHRACAAMAELDRFGILDLVFPEIKALRSLGRRSRRRLDVWGHTLNTVGYTERFVSPACRSKDLKAYLDVKVSSGHSRRALLKLGALLHDVGKPATFKVEKGKVKFHGHERVGAAMVGEISRRLRLSTGELRLLRRITFLHLRPGYLVTNPVLTARARFRFFRDAGEDAPAVLLLALADERATKGYLVLEKIRARYERLIPALMREYFAAQKKTPALRLVDGHDIMRALDLEPSPMVGRILRHLEELQAIGAVTTERQALAQARVYKKKYLKK